MHEFLSVMNNLFNEWGTLGLALNSCIESFFLVPPPDILLAGMTIKTPSFGIWYAFICTLASAVGGVIGYAIGRFGGRPAFDFLFKNNHKGFDNVEILYNKYGMAAVFFSAFTPIPYKVFTIASGILKMNFLQFFLASFVGRGARFFLVSIVIMLFGEAIKKYIELVILFATLVIILFFVILYKKRKTFFINNEQNK